MDKENDSIYQLVYTVHFLPSLFSRTKILTIMPRYCIVNCLQEPLFIRQYDKKYSLADDWGDGENLSEHPHVTTAKQVRITVTVAVAGAITSIFHSVVINVVKRFRQHVYMSPHILFSYDIFTNSL